MKEVEVSRRNKSMKNYIKNYEVMQRVKIEQVFTLAVILENSLSSTSCRSKHGKNDWQIIFSIPEEEKNMDQNSERTSILAWEFVMRSCLKP